MSQSSKEYHRAYRLRNAEKLRAKKKEYYTANKKLINARCAIYRGKNLDKLRAYDRVRRALEPWKKRALDRAYREKNRDVLNAKRAPYFAARVGLKRNYDIAYRAQNKKALKLKQLSYYEQNKAGYIARVVKRNAQKSKALPSWANTFFMEEAYRLAALRSKMFGYPWHVDHIVPLQSKIVCGLHTHNNLQVIPGADNLSKGNRHWPDMP